MYICTKNADTFVNNHKCVGKVLTNQEMLSAILRSSSCDIGEIENERLLSALETLSDLDLKILTLYAYDGYTESEIARALESKRITIHKRIERITMFLKKF